VICVGAVFAISSRKISRTWPPTDIRPVTIPHDSAALARGAHLGEAVAKCVHCHGDDLSGKMFIDDPAFGRIPAPNLTRGKGGHGMAYTDQDLVRLLRRGIKLDGRAAVIMPADVYQFLGDADLGAIIAWVRSKPPVEHEWPAATFGPVARVLLALGQPIFPADRIVANNLAIAPAPASGPTAEYGRYLAQIGGCTNCHNPSMSGGKTGGDPKAPPAANLTPGGIGGWTEADFVKVLRTGKRYGDNAPINNDFMPWVESGHMTDEEIHAVWLYLQTLPGKEFGQR
jgi:mono/diheme cytochrome c family protein